MKTSINFSLDGEKIRKLIAHKGMSQSKFADKFGISRTYVSLIVNNKTCVSPEMAKKFAKAFGLDMDDIFLPIPFTNNETSLSAT